MGHHKKQSERGSYNYLLYLPEGYSKEQRDAWPLLLFLHGADRKGVNLDALRSSGIAQLCEERLPKSREGSSSPSSSSVACESRSEVDESPCAATVDVDLEDADGDSPRTATAGLHLSRASALAQRSLHRRTPSVGGAPAMPRMQSFPFVVVSPLCPPFKYWRVESLASLLEEVAERYRVDRRRIYAIGEGMGGWAVCALAAREPQCLAACVPIGAATGPNFVDVDRLKETPLWIFHGCSSDSVGSASNDIVDADDDRDFEFDEPELNDGGAVQSDEGLRASLSLVQALRRQGARSVLFTTYPTTATSPSVEDSTDSLPGVSSFSSGSCGDNENELAKRSYTYDNPLLYQWLLQHTLPLLDV